MSNSSNIKNENIHDSVIINHVNQILTISPEYNKLLDQLNTLQKLLNRTPESETQERLEISKKISELKGLIEQLKRDVLQLAQDFQKIEVNTDRLKRAQEFFDKGEFGEARAVLATELKQMQDEQSRLLRERERYENEILPKLKHNSEEFYILALVTQFDYNNSERFTDSCRYFDLSIESDKSGLALFGYSYFLAKRNEHPTVNFSAKQHQSSESRSYSKQFLNTIPHVLSVEETAKVVFNMAILHANQNEYAYAATKFEEALELHRSLANDNPTVYLPDVSTILLIRAEFHFAHNAVEKALQDYNEALETHRYMVSKTSKYLFPQMPDILYKIALLHFARNDYEKALQEAEEAWRYYRYLASEISPGFQDEVAKTVYLLAILHFKQNEYEKASQAFDEALETYRKLAKDNPTECLPSVANTLHHSAILHYEQNRNELASERFEEALYLRRFFARDNPLAFLPDVANTLQKLADLHCKQNNHSRALTEYEEALEIRRTIYKQTSNDDASHLAEILVSIASFHQISLPMRDKSIEHAVEALTLPSQLDETAPSTQEIRERANNILRNWSLREEDVQHLITEKMRKKSRS